MGYDTEINRNKVFGSAIWKLMERFFSQGMNLLVQILMARILLPSDYGSISIILALINYADLFVQSGIATAIVQKKDVDTLDISTMMTASLAVAAVFYTIIFFAAPFVAVYYKMPELTLQMRVSAVVLFLNAINAVQTAILTRKLRFKTIFRRTALSIPISGAVGVAMALAGFGVWSLIAHNVVVILVIVIFMAFDKELRVPLGFSWKRAKALYSFGGKILLTSLITGGHDTIRTMVIGKKYSASHLAYYNKALTYSAYLTSSISTTIGSVLLPVFSRSQDDATELKKMTRRSVRLSAFFVFPVLLGFAAVCKPLVLLVLTEKWAATIPFFLVFVILRLPGCILNIDKQVYYALGRSEIYLFYEMGLFVANIATLLYTMRLGPLAIAMGATAVEMLGTLSIFTISSKVYGYKLRQRAADLIKPLAIAAVMAACVWCIELLQLGNLATLVIQVALGAAIYVLLSMLLNREMFRYALDIMKNRFIKNKKG